MMSGPKLTPEIVERDTAAAARLLARWPGVTRVWLFGSAAKGRPLDWRSDLDLAVEGMAANDQGRAWAELDETVSTARVAGGADAISGRSNRARPCRAIACVSWLAPSDEVDRRLE